MTTGHIAPKVTVLGNRRFWDDVQALPRSIGRKVSASILLIEKHGTHYPSLHTRQIEGNQDGRFRFMNVDDQYRMVAVLEGDIVLLEKVGNHDETLKWGAKATLDQYEQRLRISPDLVAPARPSAPKTEIMFEETLTLPQIVDRATEVSDLIAGDLVGALDGYVDGTIEDWMVFLSPLQAQAIQRAMSGPGRVTGGPGTGKTVVALHRAARFAAEAPQQSSILVTSFVRNVPEVMEGLFERLAPGLSGRVQFDHIHALAMRVLRQSGVNPSPDAERARRLFDRVWESDPRRHGALEGGGFSRQYVWDEITRVIEGRGVVELDDYLPLERHGRRRPMGRDARERVWEIFVEYIEDCDDADPAVVDWERVLAMACEALPDESGPRPYSAIVVDEAQDITEVGIRFLVRMLDGGTAGHLLLVGDGGQRIYPGGFRLGDLGLEVRGRSVALRLCYRSTDEIMRAVGALGSYLSTEEFGEDGLRSLATATVRTGDRPRLRRFGTPEEEASWILSELDPDDPDMDSVAILVPSNTLVQQWQGKLLEHGIGSCPLTEYRGRPRPGVKVGTYHRSKGLEFKRVYLPGLTNRFPPTDRDNVDFMVQSGSQLYVAMSRARDQLSVSYAGNPSVFIDPMRAQFDQA